MEQGQVSGNELRNGDLQETSVRNVSTFPSADITHSVLQYTMMLKYVEENQLILLTKRLNHVHIEKSRDLLRRKDQQENNNNDDDNDNDNIPPSEQIDFTNFEYTDDDVKLFRKVIEACNKLLHDIDLEMSHFVTQDDTNKLMYTIINKVSNPSIILSSQYSAVEIRAINELIDSMFIINEKQEFSYSLNASTALDIVKTSTSLNIQQSDVFLKNLELTGWLSYINRKYTLSDRSLCELKNHLIDRFGIKSNDSINGNISICHGCNEIVTRGIRCANDDCFIRFHKNCREAYVLAHSSTDCLNPDCHESINESDMKKFF